jgi:hypothetical protein
MEFRSLTVVQPRSKPLLRRKLFAKPASHTGIALSNSAGIMGDQTENDVVVANVDVWVVASGLCEYGYTIHKRHCLDEVLESPFPDELSFLKLPLRVVPEHIIDLSGVQCLFHNQYLAFAIIAALSARRNR